MERWVVQLTEAQLAKLTTEERHLGTYLSNEKGEHFLVFRDGFVALKIAKTTGAKRSLARSLPINEDISLKALAEVFNGDMLVKQA